LVALLAAWGLMTLTAGVGLADGVIRDGLGAISIGRGGTNIAHSDNGEILLDNPSAMVNIEGERLFELSADMLMCDLHYTQPPDDNAFSLFRPTGLPQLCLIRRSPDGQRAIGLGVFAPAGFGAEFDLTNPILGTHRYRSFGALAKILPGGAYRLTDRLSVGATLGVAVSYIELEGPVFLQTGLLCGAPSLLDLRATGAAPTWSTGLQYQFSDSTVLGVTYTSESRFRLNGRASADVFAMGPTPIHSDFEADVNLAWPRSVGVGINHRLCPHRRISADVIWYDWHHAFDDIGLRLANPSNPVCAALAPIHDRFPLDWRDSVSVRLGYEYFVTPDWVWRAGYVFHPNPVPDGTLTPYIPAILEHAFSIGHGRRWRQWNIDLAYQFSFGPAQHVTTSDFVGGDFDNSKVEARAHWISLSLLRQF
jgi:long-chain fatty acid transport protein